MHICRNICKVLSFQKQENPRRTNYEPFKTTKAGSRLKIRKALVWKEAKIINLAPRIYFHHFYDQLSPNSPTPLFWLSQIAPKKAPLNHRSTGFFLDHIMKRGDGKMAKWALSCVCETVQDCWPGKALSPPSNGTRKRKDYPVVSLLQCCHGDHHGHQKGPLYFNHHNIESWKLHYTIIHLYIQHVYIYSHHHQYTAPTIKDGFGSKF